MIIGTWPMVVSSHEKPDCALLERCTILASSLCASLCVGEREREREAARRGDPLLLSSVQLIPAARRPVSAFRLPQCALYSPTLNESHALTSSSCAPPPTEQRYQDPAEETVSAAISPDDLWARARHRRPPWNLCRAPRAPIFGELPSREEGGMTLWLRVLRNWYWM